MRLVAGLMVGVGEIDRYLTVTAPALLEFCDAVVARCEGPVEAEYLRALGVTVVEVPPSFFAHEGRARQELLGATLAAAPTHVLATDCDELVSDGVRLRSFCDTGLGLGSLTMMEVWEVCAEVLCTREDGGWRTHEVGCVWRVPAGGEVLRIRDQALACGRVPASVEALDRVGGSGPTGASLLHLGWANQADRQARYDRYAVADGGRFHASTHLDSIMWPESRVGLQAVAWPPMPAARRAAILRRAARP